MNNKRIRLNSNVKFDSSWEYNYLFVENCDHKPQCLICNQVISMFKKSNIERHYATTHSSNFQAIQGTERSNLISGYKLLLPISINANQPAPPVSSSLIKASYIASYEIVKAKKPFGDGAFIKEVFLKILNCLGEPANNVYHLINSISLSRASVTRRIQDISHQSEQAMIDKIKNCSYFSLALDESTDNTDTAQLLIFVRYVDSEFNVEEELLNLVSLHNQTKGEDIYSGVEASVMSIGGLSKLSAVCTDGAPSMRGSIKGLRGQFLKNNIKVPFYHCIIHQESLCAKTIGLTETMGTVISIVNKIKGGHNARTHRRFKLLLADLNSSYGDLIMFTEVRWLSRGNCLKRFFNLRKEVVEFLKQDVQNSENMQAKMNDQHFLMELAFLTDITSLLNILNLKLQIKKQNIVDMISLIDGFIKKLSVLQNEISENNLFNFESCKIIKNEFNIVNFHSFSNHLKKLENEFLSRFRDFDEIRKLIVIFRNPINCTIIEQNEKFRLELCDLQSDIRLIYSIKEEIEFWKIVPSTKYPVLTKAMLKIASMFGSTNICENTFSIMKYTKNDYRNRLSDANLRNILRIAVTSQLIDFDKLVRDFEN